MIYERFFINSASSKKQSYPPVAYLLLFLKKIFEFFVNFPLTVIGQLRKKELCPPVRDNLLLLPAGDIAKQIREKTITSTEIVSSYIKRIKEVNVVINAVIEDRFEEALLEAKKVDEGLREGKWSSEELESKLKLLGVPVSVKGSIAVKGLPLMGGMYFKDVDKRRAAEDADVVKQVKEAGAIILLISSCPELCKSFECNNSIIGTTKNPHDTRRTCGGSSGGEAALLSTCGTVISLGSDMMGSCRLPAAFCGVFGHKPSMQSVSINGHYPDSGDRENWSANFILGPLARYAEDLPLLMEVMCKPEKTDVLRLRERVDIKRIKIYYKFNDDGNLLTHKVNHEVVEKIKTVVNYFQNNVGCYTEEAKLKRLKTSGLVSLLRLLAMDDVDDIFFKQKSSVVLEFIKIALGLSKHHFPSLFYVIGKRFYDTFITPESKKKMDAAWLSLKEEFQNMLKDNSVLLYPTTTAPAFYHGQMYGNFFDGTYTGLFNVLGLPATSCPIGKSSEGLPIGLQVVANVNCDRLTFAVAQEIQKAFGGWITPQFQ